MRALLLLSPLLLFVFACPSSPEEDAGQAGDGDGDGLADAGGDEEDGGAPTESDGGGDGDADCDIDGFGPAVGGNYLTTGLGDFLLLHDGTEAPLKKVQLELYVGSRAPLEHTIAGENFADCEVCLSLLDACASPSGDCDVQYVAEAGDVELTTYNDTLIEGTLRGVEAVEVTIDPDTFVSTPVPGGGSWCLQAISFSQAVGD